MWIPRFAYHKNGEIAYLKDTSIIEIGDWTVPTEFTYTAIPNNLLELNGIWIEKKIQSSTSQNTNNINAMNKEDNIYGLISNSKVEAVSVDTIDILKKLNNKYLLDYMDDYTSMQRSKISVIDTNQKEVIQASAAIVDTTAYVDVTYTKYGIDRIIYEFTGETLVDGKYNLSRTGGFYIFVVVDKEGNTKVCTAGHEENPPELIGFNVDTTFLVTYSGEIAKGTATEYVRQSVRKVLEDGAIINENNCLESGTFDDRKVEKSRGKWYQYNEQKWANIVVRNNGNEAYFVWIPRYAYKLNDDETSEIVFINTDNEEARTGEVIDLEEYTIPDAFHVEEENGEVKQLSGFWAGKYQLSSYVANAITANVYSGINKIRISNMTNKIISTSESRYDIAVVQNGDEIFYQKNVDASLYEVGASTGKRLNAGSYTVRVILYDKSDRYMGEITYPVIVYDQVANINTLPEKPVLEGFGEHTYYVVYDENGNEDSSTPISQAPPDNWYNYAEQKWANVVVRNEGNEAYFVWIPRYEYHAYSGYEFTDVNFIPVEQTEPSYACTIPEAFTVQNEDGTKTELSGFWAGKYQLSSFTNFGLTAGVYSGINKIRVSNITNSIISRDNARYDLYVMKEEQIVYYAENVDASLYEFGESTNQKLEAGIYNLRIVVYDERDYYRGEKTYEIEVYNQVANTSNLPEKPVLDGFNREITYYVTYDEEGNEVLTPLEQGEPGNWYNYAEQKWANIVVKNEEVGKTAYFVWIPRYEYHAYSGYEFTDVNFILTSQTEPSYGCTIPDAFHVVEEDGTVKELPGFWAGKYQLSN